MQVRCSGCGKTLQVADQHAGKKVKCPCGVILSVPAAKSAAPAAKVPGGAAAGLPGRVAAPASAPAKPVAATRPPSAPQPALPKSGKPLGLQTPRSHLPATTGIGGGFDSSEVAGLFSGLSDADLKAPSPYVPLGMPSVGAHLAGGTMAGQHAATSEEQSATRAAASKHLFQSLGILIFLGLVRVVIYGYFYMDIQNEVDSLTVMDPDLGENIDWLVTALKVVYGMFVLIGVGFLVCAGLAFQFPMTSTITALVLYILSEIVGFITAPWTVLSIRGWIIKAAIFGGLVQAINNASYYKFVKTGGRD